MPRYVISKHQNGFAHTTREAVLFSTRFLFFAKKPCLNCKEALFETNAEYDINKIFLQNKLKDGNTSPFIGTKTVSL